MSDSQQRQPTTFRRLYREMEIGLFRFQQAYGTLAVILLIVAVSGGFGLSLFLGVGYGLEALTGSEDARYASNLVLLFIFVCLFIATMVRDIRRHRRRAALMRQLETLDRDNARKRRELRNTTDLDGSDRTPP